MPMLPFISGIGDANVAGDVGGGGARGHSPDARWPSIVEAIVFQDQVPL